MLDSQRRNVSLTNRWQSRLRSPITIVHSVDTFVYYISLDNLLPSSFPPSIFRPPSLFDFSHACIFTVRVYIFKGFQAHIWNANVIFTISPKRFFRSKECTIVFTYTKINRCIDVRVLSSRFSSLLITQKMIFMESELKMLHCD